MSSWLLRALVWVAPADWRATIVRDLEDEARAQGHGPLWCGWQAVRVGLKLRWTSGGSVMLFDLRYAIRSLRAARWFTLGAIATFALGIGVNVAVFSAVDRVLFRSLPYADPDRLVVLRNCGPTTGKCGVGNFPDLLMVEASGRLQTMGEWALIGFSSPRIASPLTPDDPPIRLFDVSSNMLRVLGVSLRLGRDITDEEARRGDLVGWLSEETWVRRFGATDDVLTRTVGSSTRPIRIIGILPRGFIPPTWGTPDPAWDGLVAVPKPRVFPPVARLAPGASIEAARSEVAAMVEQLGGRLRSPRDPAGAPLPFIRVDPVESTLFEASTDHAWLVALAAGLVLLMACANLAGLLLARGQSRQGETALRMALGASSWRVAGTALYEMGLLCFAGLVAAVTALYWVQDALLALLPPLFARNAAGVADLRIIGVAIAATLFSAVAGGLWPAFRMTRVGIDSRLLRTSSGRRLRLPGGPAIIVVETALGVLLVFGAVLTIRSFNTLVADGVGFDPQDLYRVRVTPNPSPAAPKRSPADQLAAYETWLAASRAIPGVVAVAGSDSVVGGGATAMRAFSKDRSQGSGRYEVSAGHFAAIGSVMVAGREFTDEEVRSRAPVALLNPAGLAAVWPGDAADAVVGRTLQLPGESPRTVVGVVPTLRRQFGDEGRADLYVPLGAEPAFYGEWIIRMAHGQSPSLDAVRGQLQPLTAGAPVSLFPVTDALEPSLRDPRFRASLFGMLALSALAIAAAGLYAIVAFDVSLRRREMGVRLALGAVPRQLQRLVVQRALGPVVIGVVVALPVAYWAATWLEAFLHRVEARGLSTFVVVAAVLIVSAALAAWIPARRAARTDPAIVLRAQ